MEIEQKIIEFGDLWPWGIGVQMTGNFYKTDNTIIERVDKGFIEHGWLNRDVWYHKKSNLRLQSYVTLNRELLNYLAPFIKKVTWLDYKLKDKLAYPIGKLKELKPKAIITEKEIKFPVKGITEYKPDNRYKIYVNSK